jgi:hypothetical protein
MHTAVAVLFGLALLCYLSQWFDAALALGLLGFLFEIAAWIAWFATDASRKTANVSSRPSKAPNSD